MIETAIQAAVKAGQKIKEIYDKFDNEQDTEYTSDNIVSYKSDNSPLTLADKEANKIIEKHLKPLGIPILSEEGIIIPSAVYLSQLWHCPCYLFIIYYYCTNMKTKIDSFALN